MDSFIVNGCDTKKGYVNFIKVMLAYSEAFSFIYFKHSENEHLTKRAAWVKEALSPYLICSKSVLSWPGTTTFNSQRHIYTFELYKSDPNTLDVFESVDSLWEWNYPDYPMDLAFYINGYAWFYSVTHEHINQLCITQPSAFLSEQDLRFLGISLIPKGDVKINDLFYEKSAVII